MLSYSFTCPNCNDHRILQGQDVVNQLFKTGWHQCGICNTISEADQSKIFEDEKPEPVDYYHETSVYRGYDGQDFPAPRDMEAFGEDLEDVEHWQRLILEEFGKSDDLTRDDKYGYEDALHQLKSQQFGWVKLGAWAFQFKLKRFYKYHHKTWREFCEKVLHQSHWYVDKIIKATRVIKDLLCAGFDVLPQNEYQCRPLTKFWGEELIDNWGMIVDAVEPHLITSDLIKSRFCSREKRDNKWLKVDGQVWEEFEYKSRSKGLDPKQIIENILDDWEANYDEETTDELDDDDIEDVPIEKLEVWQADLQALIEEKDRSDNWFTKLILWSFSNDRGSPVSGFP